MINALELFHFWVPVAALLALTLIWRHWQDRQVGLLFTYVVSFASIYLIAPALYLLPEYHAPGAEDTAVGLRTSAIALAALWVGAEIMTRVLARRHTQLDETDRQEVDGRLANVYMIAGTVLYVFVMPILGRAATLTALVSTAATLVVVGFCLKCWNAWVQQAQSRLWTWLVITVVFPIVTVTAQGYLGYGLAAAATIMAFAASFYRPRWKVVLFGFIMAYGMLSVYVTYMRDRNDIRASVWGGETLEQRLTRLGNTFSSPEAFNVNDPVHLARIEDRLNQDALIGRAVDFIAAGREPYAGGSTFMEAVLSPIPRVLWPNKPILAGSGDLVSRFTGLRFGADTSVGVGHVLESYVNFGTTGVMVVFVLLGALLVFIDSSAYQHLHAGDGRAFVLWYLPGLGLLQVGGSLSEATGFAAAAWLMARLVNFLVSRMTVPEAVGAADADATDTSDERGVV